LEAAKFAGVDGLVVHYRCFLYGLSRKIRKFKIRRLHRLRRFRLELERRVRAKITVSRPHNLSLHLSRGRP
jgi:hypothetical protein